MKKYEYSDKPLIQRIVLLLAGFFNFLLGYAIYFILKDEKKDYWQVEFIQRGATFGLAFTIISLIIWVISACINGIAL